MGQLSHGAGKTTMDRNNAVFRSSRAQGFAAFPRCRTGCRDAPVAPQHNFAAKPAVTFAAESTRRRLARKVATDAVFGLSTNRKVLPNCRAASFALDPYRAK